MAEQSRPGRCTTLNRSGTSSRPPSLLARPIRPAYEDARDRVEVAPVAQLGKRMGGEVSSAAVRRGQQIVDARPTITGRLVVVFSPRFLVRQSEHGDVFGL